MNDTGTYPVINGGINPSGYVEVFNEEEDTITISQGGASAGYVNFQKSRFWLGAHCYAVKPYDRVLNRYLFHFIKQNEIALQQCQYGAGIPALAKGTISSLSIPVPPLPVQEEIVRILDNFTTLEAELEAELDCRKRQYEYYRDKLLNKSKSENEYKRVKLGEIGTFTRGRRFVHADDRDEGIPCIHYGELYTHYGVWADKVKTHINPELTTNFRYADKNDVIIVAAGENNVDIGIGVAWLGNEKVAVHDACFIFKHNQNPKFISYALRTYDYHQQIKSKVSQGKICSISADGLANAEIPLPPLAVQERIVNVLDNFEQLCNDLGIGLPAEIEARKKQYEYYRNKLLSFTPPQQLIDYQFIIFGVKINDYIKIMQYVFGYVYVPMSEIAEICPGKDYRHLSNGEVPVYGSGGVMTYVNDYTYDKPTVLLPRKGSISNIFYVDVPFWNVDTIYYTKIDNSKVITKFLYYLVVNEHIEKYNTSNAARPALTREVLNKIVFPLPPLSEQERIVSILDRFDTLVNDISQGLPAEIAARRKQYEYYRDKLLTFKEKTA